MVAVKSDFQVATERVESALKRLRMSKTDVAEAKVELSRLEVEERNAQIDFDKARAQFLEEYPEMAPAQVTTAVVEGSPDTPQPAPVEEATPRPVMTPQGPVVFREMDDSPFGDGS